MGAFLWDYSYLLLKQTAHKRFWWNCLLSRAEAFCKIPKYLQYVCKSFMLCDSTIQIFLIILFFPVLSIIWKSSFGMPKISQCFIIDQNVLLYFYSVQNPGVEASCYNAIYVHSLHIMSMCFEAVAFQGQCFFRQLYCNMSHRS